LTHEVRDKADVDKYGMEANSQTITDSLEKLNR